MPTIIAKTRYVRQSPRKMRLVADLVRGLKAQDAVEVLENLNKRAAEPILRVLKQGIGNATNNTAFVKDSLRIKILEINEGPRYKRMDKSHRVFRWGTIMKRTSHVRLVIEGEAVVAKKSEAKTSSLPIKKK